jgi:pyruvate formate lyase activating enzyme
VAAAGTAAALLPDRDTAAGRVGWLHSWDLSTGVDGPGTRCTAFLAGCPLRCVYCHNPDTWTRAAAERVTADDLVARVLRYRRLYELTGGGATLSGGEPLAQPAFVTEVTRRLAAEGVSVALDTSGYLGAAASDALLDDLDLVLLDIKSSDEPTYRRVTGRPLQPTLDFARRLGDRGVRVWVRFVVVPGWTDEPADVAGVARIAAGIGTVERVDVLPFHRLGAAKYEALGLRYPVADVEPPSPALLDRVRGQFAAAGLLAT